METTYTTFSTLKNLTQAEAESSPLRAEITIEHGRYVPERYSVTLAEMTRALKREDIRRFAEAFIAMDDRINEVVKVQYDNDKYVAVILANSNLNRNTKGK